ncbi:2-oxo acid dehydrogenase subunit E2 [Mycoplasmopsis agassizii]|uniref:2-oxo acid dehydrogenase subunit E2 n=1 Tax=Mycoplasmopsis agassizii TaxID=33922 RepID=UPI0035297785
MSQAQVKITPLARVLANKKNIDITLIKGSGFNGKIYESDVINYKPSKVADLSATFVDKNSNISASSMMGELVAKREKINFVRKAIAKAMKNSWANVAYVNLKHRVNVSKLWDIRKEIKDDVKAEKNVNLTFLAFVVKAVTLALKEFPIFGAKYDEKTEEIVYPNAVNIGIAVDTDHGLFVPVIKDADQKSVVEIAAEIVSLAKAARDKNLKPAQMQGATFTITNYGSVGSLHGLPVINYPEIGILGLGAIVDEAFYSATEKKLVAGKAMYLTTAADHRWIDGSTIGRFTTRVANLLEKPSLLGVY